MFLLTLIINIIIARPVMPVKKKKKFTRSPFKIFKLNNNPSNVKFY